MILHLGRHVAGRIVVPQRPRLRPHRWGSQAALETNSQSLNLREVGWIGMEHTISENRGYPMKKARAIDDRATAVAKVHRRSDWPHFHPNDRANQHMRRVVPTRQSPIGCTVCPPYRLRGAMSPHSRDVEPSKQPSAEALAAQTPFATYRYCYCVPLA